MILHYIEEPERFDSLDEEEVLDYIQYIRQHTNLVEVLINSEDLPENSIPLFIPGEDIIKLNPAESSIRSPYYRVLYHQFTHKINVELLNKFIM